MDQVEYRATITPLKYEDAADLPRVPLPCLICRSQRSSHGLWLTISMGLGLSSLRLVCGALFSRVACADEYRS